jgi:hypothetical protein
MGPGVRRDDVGRVPPILSPARAEPVIGPAEGRTRWLGRDDVCKEFGAYIRRSTIISLSSAIASEGLRLFGQALAQFMMVWQR